MYPVPEYRSRNGRRRTHRQQARESRQTTQTSWHLILAAIRGYAHPAHARHLVVRALSDGSTRCGHLDASLSLMGRVQSHRSKSTISGLGPANKPETPKPTRFAISRTPLPIQSQCMHLWSEQRAALHAPYAHTIQGVPRASAMVTYQQPGAHHDEYGRRPVLPPGHVSGLSLSLIHI